MPSLNHPRSVQRREHPARSDEGPKPLQHETPKLIVVTAFDVREYGPDDITPRGRSSCYAVATCRPTYPSILSAAAGPRWPSCPLDDRHHTVDDAAAPLVLVPLDVGNSALHYSASIAH